MIKACKPESRSYGMLVNSSSSLGKNARCSTRLDLCQRTRPFPDLQVLERDLRLVVTVCVIRGRHAHGPSAFGICFYDSGFGAMLTRLTTLRCGNLCRPSLLRLQASAMHGRCISPFTLVRVDLFQKKLLLLTSRTPRQLAMTQDLQLLRNPNL